MYQAAVDPNVKIYIKDATKYIYKKDRKTVYDWSSGRQIIRWESRKGLRTKDGGHQSPATRLEHEFAHAIDHSYDGSGYKERKENTNVKNYLNEEEKYVVEGAETKTALANGEDIRKDHYGTTYDVISSDSTTPLFK